MKRPASRHRCHINLTAAMFGMLGIRLSVAGLAAEPPGPHTFASKFAA